VSQVGDLNVSATCSQVIVIECVTDVHDVTGLIHGPTAGADAFCIYLESFSFSLLCTIEYMYTVLPNFHIVTE